ncbi:hypothetical protein [uncultured Roseibium sp.]|uniref:hypothetical protein n=1 Tax=uncultured Roseibium sp. TaxID=1936171 RepID=UPI002627C3EB|nr:hypothetical protein [uncultured Roseibium sp.]
MKTIVAALLFAAMIGSAYAVDPGDWETKPPDPTQTSKECPDGEAWDDKTKKCVELDAHLFNDADRYRAARELAYAGRYVAAGLALDAMTDQTDTVVLTYRGFIARKSGDWAAAEAFYGLALAANPDNLFARSYLGMGLVDQGDPGAARVQLAEIRARGGRETWPERALLMSIRSGGGAFY